MKNSRNKPLVQRTHVKQPGPGKAAPKFVEYAVDTPEQAAEIRRIAEAYAKKHGLKVTITDIECGPTDESSAAIKVS